MHRDSYAVRILVVSLLFLLTLLGIIGLLATDSRQVSASLSYQVPPAVQTAGPALSGSDNATTSSSSECGLYADIASIPTADARRGGSQYLICRQIATGYTGSSCTTAGGDPCFLPNNSLTRQQLTKIVANADVYNDNVSTLYTFHDVPIGSTFHDYVERYNLHGLTDQSYPCGGVGEPCDSANRPYFRPGSNALRVTIAIAAVRSSAYSQGCYGGQTFQDVSSSNPYYCVIETAVRRGIMGGYPCGGSGEPCIAPGNLPYFRPNAGTTRGQVGKMMFQTGINYEPQSGGDAPYPGTNNYEVSPGTTVVLPTPGLPTIPKGILDVEAGSPPKGKTNGYFALAYNIAFLPGNIQWQLDNCNNNAIDSVPGVDCQYQTAIVFHAFNRGTNTCDDTSEFAGSSSYTDLPWDGAPRLKDACNRIFNPANSEIRFQIYDVNSLSSSTKYLAYTTLGDNEAQGYQGQINLDDYQINTFNSTGVHKHFQARWCYQDLNTNSGFNQQCP